MQGAKTPITIIDHKSGTGVTSDGISKDPFFQKVEAKMKEKQ